MSEKSLIAPLSGGGQTGAAADAGKGNLGGEAGAAMRGRAASTTIPFGHALSSVLNGPHVDAEESLVTSLMHGDYNALWESPLKQLGMQPEGSWAMPAVPPLTGFPIVNLDDFREYLAEVGDLMSKFESISPAHREGLPEVKHNPGALQDMLTSVPALYFDKDFRIDDNATFEKTGVSDEAVGGSEEPSDLQDHLSHYLDIVEQNLMYKIQDRSERFYKALDDLQALYAEVEGTMETIVKFRDCMRRLDERLVGHALRIAQLRRRKKNMEELHRKLGLVATVRQTQHNLQILLSCSDFVAALDLISSALRIIDTELKGVNILRATAAQLQEMNQVVQKMMCAEFVSLSMGKDRMMTDTSGVCGDLGGEQADGDEGGLGALDPSSLAVVEDQLLALALALVRVGKLPDVLSEYKNAAVRDVLNAIKAVLRDELPAVSESEERVPPLAERLRNLEFDEFLRVMKRLYTVLESVLARCSNVHGLLCAVLKAHEESGDADDELGGGVIERPELKQDYTMLQTMSVEVLEHVCDTAHQRCGRLLAVREQLTTHLSLASFTQLFDATVEFVNQSEKLCGRQKKHALRATLLAQAKVFMEQLHTGNVSKLNLLLDQERWQQIDVPSEIQRLVNECIKPSDGLHRHLNGHSHAASDPPAKQLLLDGEKYCIVPVMTALLKMVSDYVACCVQLPALGADIVQRMLDLVKIFNTRSCQLVLGARAMALAGLKTITAKHLALSAQCIVFLQAFVPFVQASLRRTLPDRQHVLLAEFDKVVQDLGAHRDELYSKLVAIMKERLEHHCRNIGDEQWNSPGQGEPGAYMKGLVKELQALHRVLAGTLDARAVQGVVIMISHMLAKRLPEHWTKLPLSTTVSQHRVVADVAYLTQAFQSLEGVTITDRDLEGLQNYCSTLSVCK